MSDDHNIRQDIYQRTRDDLLKRQLSNSENFDRSILTLSLAALGLSLTFIKNVVEFRDASQTWLLFGSWLLFVLAIISTLLSFITSQSAITKQLEYAEKYYLDKDNQFLKRKNWSARFTDWCSYISAVCFTMAVICMVFFTWINLPRKGNEMSRKPTPSKVNLTEGARVPQMQAVPKPHEQAGAPVPAMQGVPQPSQKPGESETSNNQTGTANESGTSSED